MPTDYRETTIRISGIEQTVRTPRITTVAKMDREHTTKVRQALTTLRLKVIDDHEAREVAEIEAREWPDKDGWPGSGASTKASILQQTREWAGKQRARLKRPTTIRSPWDDYRRPWPKPRFDIAVTDPRVADAHQYINQQQLATTSDAKEHLSA